MGIYIKCMKMPERCAKCFLKQSCGKRIYMERRPDNCPIIDLPRHGRLIDADALERMFVDIDNAPYSGFDGAESFYSAADAAQIIRLAPTVIQASEEEMK